MTPERSSKYVYCLTDWIKGAAKRSPKRRSENSEYCPLYSGPAHWIPAFAGMTEYGLYRDLKRLKASFQTASKSRFRGNDTLTAPQLPRLLPSRVKFLHRAVAPLAFRATGASYDLPQRTADVVAEAYDCGAAHGKDGRALVD